MALDSSHNYMGAFLGWFTTNITSNTTTKVKDAPGIMKGIAINQGGTAETITVKDGTTVLGTITTPSSAGFIDFPAGFETSIVVETAGTTAGDYTVFYV